MSLTIVGVAIFHQATTAVIPWFIDGERMSCLFWRGVFPPSSKQKGKEFVDARFTKETRTNLRTVCSIQDSSKFKSSPCRANENLTSSRN